MASSICAATNTSSALVPEVVDFNVSEIDGIVDEFGRSQEAVIPILQAMQNRYGYLPEQGLERIAELTDISPASITGVATFYSQFRLQPAGKHSIKVCIGTACHVMGAPLLIDAFKRHLEIPENEDTDRDRLFTVESVGCLGCCMLAPAVQIDEVTYGFVTTTSVESLLNDFLATRNIKAESNGQKKTKGKRPDGEVRLCLCSSCAASGATQVHQEILHLIDQFDLPAIVKVVGCTGMAYQGPLIEIQITNEQNFSYGKVQAGDVEKILLQHFRPMSLKSRITSTANRALERLLSDHTWEPVTRFAVDVRSGADATFAGPQHHCATEHSGEVAPLDLDEYINRGGFSAVKRCISDLSQHDIINEVEMSGLRGRGGGGFQTAAKWKMVAAAKSERRFVICNGDEGDPGAFMDRMLLESFPFRVIEGMIIASIAVGSSQGYFYIRAEYPLAMARIREALDLLGKKNLLGNDILGSGHHFHLNIVAGAGAFVCGEETALIAAIEGRRGTPHIRPPYPAEEGLWGCPTLVNNVETFALVPSILRGGGADFAEIGTPKSSGTKSFALAGKIVRSGLIEVPMGTTLREIVDEIGGGVREGHQLKAIQVGGPSGGCVPAALADTPVDYESLTAAGAMMGSGGLVVLDETDCMVEIARYFMAFTQAESCGACTACRIGTKRLLEILEKLCRGEAKAKDLQTLIELSSFVKLGSVCGLGKTAPNPVLSTLQHFQDEFEAHLEGRCPAARCKDLIAYSITTDCIGCTMCAQRCPTAAIIAKPYELHAVDMELCIRCDACREICPEDCVKVE